MRLGVQCLACPPAGAAASAPTARLIRTQNVILLLATHLQAQLRGAQFHVPLLQLPEGLSLITLLRLPLTLCGMHLLVLVVQSLESTRLHTLVRRESQHDNTDPLLLGLQSSESVRLLVPVHLQPRHHASLQVRGLWRQMRAERVVLGNLLERCLAAGCTERLALDAVLLVLKSLEFGPQSLQGLALFSPMRLQPQLKAAELPVLDLQRLQRILLLSAACLESPSLAAPLRRRRTKLPKLLLRLLQLDPTLPRGTELDVLQLQLLCLSPQACESLVQRRDFAVLHF
mmetsp:Transcript_72463/g.200958  ORF Transcript_72463/g.200958 Transcript_72463/m.200958 type:complete len:286 (-) Transcript_72463:1036-1893(-)